MSLQLTEEHKEGNFKSALIFVKRYQKGKEGKHPEGSYREVSDRDSSGVKQMFIFLKGQSVKQTHPYTKLYSVQMIPQ